MIARDMKSCPSVDQQSGFSLIELTVVVAILMVLVAIIMVGYGGAIQKAHDAACGANLKSCRTAIQAYRASHADDPPPDVATLIPEYLQPDNTNCPETRNPYVYSAVTGRVNCTLARHAAY